MQSPGSNFFSPTRLDAERLEGKVTPWDAYITVRKTPSRAVVSRHGSLSHTPGFGPDLVSEDGSTEPSQGSRDHHARLAVIPRG